jgi:hypothetical protein
VLHLRLGEVPLIHETLNVVGMPAAVSTAPTH